MEGLIFFDMKPPKADVDCLKPIGNLNLNGRMWIFRKLTRRSSLARSNGMQWGKMAENLWRMAYGFHIFPMKNDH